MQRAIPLTASDHGGFTKFTRKGPDVAAVLNRLVRGSVPTIGRVRLPFMLTPWGHIWSEATIARFADNSFCLLDGPRYKAAPMALIAQARRDPQNVDHNQP